MNAYSTGKFSLADVYGSAFATPTTRMESVPEPADQEALVDDTQAKVDLKQQPGEARNILIFIGAIVAVVVLFSIF